MCVCVCVVVGGGSGTAPQNVRLRCLGDWILTAVVNVYRSISIVRLVPMTVWSPQRLEGYPRSSMHLAPLMV